MKQKVIIMKCDDYDPDKIAGIVKEGMQELGVKPAGKILLKPNAVIAHRELFPHAFTRKEFIDGVLAAVKYHSANAKEISLGERSGITLPTRFCFKEAGYMEIIKKHKIKAKYFDEEKQVPRKLDNKNALRSNIFIPKSIDETDFLINLPKFKAHPWTRVTFSLKNFIGIQDDRHRLVDHNSYLEHKIADLQEVIQPKFIAIDGIIAGQKMMLTPTPFNLGAIIMGTNSCAVDAVACHMVNIDPKIVHHIRYTSERGFGPIDLKQIEVTGDYPLKDIKKKTKNFEFCMERIDDYFNNKGNIKCTVGKFPEKHSKDYCWGGCPGALQESMHIFRAFDKDVDTNIKKIHYVVGKVDHDLNIEEDETVIFAGDCTSWKGEIDGEKVEIKSSYKTTNEVDEKKTKSNDMLLKTFKTMANCIKNRKSRYVQAKGCTISVGDHIHYISFFGKIKNINFDPKLMFPLNIQYMIMRFNRMLNKRK